MHGRKLATTGTAAALAILAIVGGCREATTGPTSVKPQDFASAVKLLSGNQQSGAVGAALPEVLSVKVVDAGGVPVAGATVLWQVRDGGGTINPPASTTTSAGLADVTWTLGSSLGANKAVAILEGNYVLDSAVFTATALTGPAQTMAATAGNLQTATVASTLPVALVVNVKDQFGHAVAGAHVTWAAALFSGTVTPLADSTDSSGNVSASWTLGTAAIGQTVTASATGLTPIVFSATGTPDASRVLTATAGSSQTALAGAALATQLQITVKDQYGNIITGETVVFNDSIGSGGSVSPTQAVTNASGIASSTWTLGQSLGTQVARARVGTTKLSFSATSTAQFTQVAAGNYFSCGVTVGDRAYCWGFGDDGQRGIGAGKSAAQPGAPVTSADTLVGPFPTWRSLGSGSSFVCGLSIARQAYCWGRLASVNQVNFPTLRAFGADVVSFTAVQSAENHSCALLTDGRLACTGSNGQGQLGDGLTADQTTDYVVAGSASGLLWSGFAVGGNHTCAMPKFNPADSLNTSWPWCWGARGSGQLGAAGALTANSTVPLQVTMPVGAPAFDSTSLTAGAAHTCALSRAGAAYCWGSNGWGQLGKGTVSARDSVPQLVTGGYVFARLYGGEYHTCGVTTSGQAYCWGRNTSGQLGDGTQSLAPQPTPQLVAGGLTWRSLSLGELHSCGVAAPTGSGSGTQTGAGVIYCWGDNEYGQLGTGVPATNGVPVLTPQMVKGQVTNP